MTDSQQPPSEKASRRQRILIAIFRKSPWIIFAALVVLLAFVLINWNDLESNRRHQRTNNAYIHFDTISLETKVSGYIREVGFTDFERVEAGHVLVTLVDDEYRIAVKKNEAELLRTRANLANLAIEERLQAEQLEEARAVLDSSSAKLDLAQREYRRYAALVERGAVSRSLADNSSTELKAAQADHRERQAQVDVRQSNLDLLKANRALREADVKAAEAALEQSLIDLGHTRLVAPTEAVTSSARVRRGELVKVGTQVANLVPVQLPYIIANYKETQLTRIRPGQPVEISVDTFPGEVLKGYVSALSPASGATFALLPTDNSSGNFTKVVQRIPVRIDLEEGQVLTERLRAGMSVETSIDTVAADDD